MPRISSPSWRGCGPTSSSMNGGCPGRHGPRRNRSGAAHEERRRSRTAAHRHLSAVLAGQGVRRRRRPDRAASGPLFRSGRATELGRPAHLPADRLPDARDRVRHPELLTTAIEGLARRDVRVVVELSADAIAEHTQKLLPRHGHGGHRDAARAIAEEIARMPPRTRSPAVSRSTQPAGEPPGPASPLTRLLASRQGKPCRSGSGWRGGPTGSTGGWWCGCRCRRRSCPGRSFPLRAPVAVSGRGTRRR